MKRPIVEKTTFWITENELIESITIEDENEIKYAHTYKRWEKSIGWRAIARWDNMLGNHRGVLLFSHERTDEKEEERIPEKEIEKCKDFKEVLRVVLEKYSSLGNERGKEI